MSTKPETMSQQDWDDFLEEEEQYKRIEAKQDEYDARKASREEYNFERDSGAAW